MRLFVDCDDTLVLWKDTSSFEQFYSGSGQPNNFTVNEPLVNAVKTFLSQNKDSVLVVWSGGGKNYARHWGVTIFHDVPHIVAEKHGALPLITKGDIMVDNQQLQSNGVKSITAEKFIEREEKKRENNPGVV